MTKKLAGKAVKKRFIYFGPTLPGVAKEGTVYVNGIPKKLEEACTEMPVLKEFICTLSEYQKKAKAVKDQDSALSSLYDDIKKKWR